MRHPDDTMAQHGQAMVLGMLLAGALMAIVLRYFSFGQVVAAKSRQTHALDAAAYSAALAQARALNMLAYINRAHVAHQMAMAHLATLASWSALSGTQAMQASIGNPPAHVIGMFFGPSHAQAYMAAARAAGLGQAAGTHAELARAYAFHDDTVHGLLTKVQAGIVNSVPQMRMAVLETVLAHHYPESSRHDAQLHIANDQWPRFLRRMPGRGPQSGIRRLSQQAQALYGFLGRRDYTERGFWPASARCPSRRHQLRRRGSTQLDGHGHWVSADTQSFHAVRSNRWVACYRREYPMGWGLVPGRSGRFSGPHEANPPADFSREAFWRWARRVAPSQILNGRSNLLANSWAMLRPKRLGGRGLPDYFDLAPASSDAALRFAVTLHLPGPDGLRIATHSGAEAYFAVPPLQKKKERAKPNLFQPYWQARLADPRANGTSGQTPSTRSAMWRPDTLSAFGEP